MRTLIALAFIALTITGCTSPEIQPSGSDAQIQTRVAATLTALAVPETPTVAPSVPVLASTASVLSTTTPIVDATPTITPTHTPTEGDFSASLGEPDFRDSFNSGKDWYLTDDDQTTIELDNGSLALTSINAIGWHGWSMNYRKVKDFYLEATMRTSECSGSDRYGLAFRSPDYQKGYFLAITCDGTYGILESDGAQFTTVSAFQYSPNIIAGANQINRIGVKAIGSQLTVYLNGELMPTVDDSSFTETGVFGVFVAGYATPGFTILIDDISYWTLE